MRSQGRLLKKCDLSSGEMPWEGVISRRDRKKHWDDADYGGVLDRPQESTPDPLEAFADAGYITDVLHRIKSGKEATVYCCRAHPSMGGGLVAAKVYSVQTGAHYRMSNVYADGRMRVHKPDRRVERAIKARGRFGRQFVFGDWVGQEHTNLELLHSVGADVPRPIHQCGAGILMDYIGDGKRPAPMLVRASLASREAQQLFDQVMRNVVLFLAKDRVHGDLSPYNMLLWRGRVVIIDLPQMVHARWNQAALSILQRDVENVVKFFGRYGVRASAGELTLDLWDRYRRAELKLE